MYLEVEGGTSSTLSLVRAKCLGGQGLLTLSSTCTLSTIAKPLQILGAYTYMLKPRCYGRLKFNPRYLRIFS